VANLKLPDPLARRHLLEGDLSKDKARAYGEAYVAAGRPVEAIDFLEIGDARDTLSALQKEALEQGDAFLMRVSSGALGEDPGSELWTRLAEKAESLGREQDAETARRLATVGD